MTKTTSFRSRAGFLRLFAFTFSAGLALTGIQVLAQTADYSYTGKIQFDIKRQPFSRFGSYLGISDMNEYEAPYTANGVFIRTMHGGGKRAFQIQLLRDGISVPFTASATPTLLTLSGGGGSVEICFQGPDRIRLRGKAVELRLVAVDSWAVAYPQGKWEITNSAMKSMLWPVQGQVQESVLAGENGSQPPALTFEPSQGSDSFEAELDAYTSAWLPHGANGSFDQAEAQEKQAYAAWLKTMPRVPDYLGYGAETAAYTNWESIVSPSGNLKRPAMLMSKNWMSSIWSWDQTFNAIATSLSDPALAWNQFLLPVDVQDPTGSFPDKWDADSIAWEFSKPPVHGWALAWLFRRPRRSAAGV